MKPPLVIGIAIPLLAAVGAGVYYLSEARRLEARMVFLESRNATLETELAAAIAQRDEVSRFLQDKVDEIRKQDADRRQRLRNALRPMPEGVRLALVAINDSLAGDGFPEVRLLSARAIEDRALLNVELLELDRASQQPRLFVADRLTLHLERKGGTLTIRLFGGHRWVGGERVPFPVEGWPIALAAVEGPKWEARLPQLLEASGVYPADELAPKRGLDRYTLAMWATRVNRLLDGAATDYEYQIAKIGGLQDGVFDDVMLTGSEQGKALSLALEARRMTITTDARSKTVELFLEDGWLRKAGGKTRIREYRILLPGVTPDDAMETMMGMVVSR